MVSEDAATKVLEYIKKHGQTNTFRLASELGVDRSRILNIVEKLEEKEAVEVRSGIVFFLKFPRKEKKAVKKVAKPKKKARRKSNALEDLKAENKRLKEKLLELEANKERQTSIKNKKIREQDEQIENLKKTIKEVQKAPPKIITRTKVKEVVKRVPVKSRKLKEQTKQIEKLEEKIKELKEKVSKPKIIRRTIVKKVPKIIRKIIIKKVFVKVKEKKPKEKIKPKKFKLPKIDFSGLHKNIKKIHVPEILKR